MANRDGVAAAILAGGRAQRFGKTDKSALMFDGTTIMARLVSVLGAVTPHIFAVGDRFGAASAEGLRVVPDVIPDAGALGGIYTAIVSSPCDRTVVVGCDMPFITEAFVRHLVRLSSGGGHVSSVLPRTANGYEPLCAIYACETATGIRKRLDSGERQASVPPGGRVVEVGPEELAAFDPHGLLFVNVNTPHDYEQARLWTKVRSQK
jgi:molybdopterin-guanine dinucleotide biosynthesis protein A